MTARALLAQASHTLEVSILLLVPAVSGRFNSRLVFFGVDRIVLNLEHVFRSGVRAYTKYGTAILGYNGSLPHELCVLEYLLEQQFRTNQSWSPDVQCSRCHANLTCARSSYVRTHTHTHE